MYETSAICPSDEQTNHSLGALWIEFRADNNNADVPSRQKGKASYRKFVSARRVDGD